MAKELKTKKNTASIAQFLNSIEDDQKRKDSKAIDKMLREVTGKKPAMWGASIVGYGSYTYTGSNGKTNEWMAIGFSPRKQNLTLYILPGYEFPAMSKLLAKLGRYSTGKSCLYVKKLEDVDMNVLQKMCELGYKKIQGKHIDYAEMRKAKSER